MKRKMMLTTLTFMMCTMMWSASVGAEKASDFKMETSATESVNGEFTVTLKGENIKDLYAYEAKFNFDPNVLEVVKAESSIKGFSVSPITKGKEITIAHTKIGNVNGETGKLSITKVTFKAKKAGSSEVKWTDLKILDRNLKSQEFKLTNASKFTKLFKDMVKHWAKDDVMEMVTQGVVLGVDADTFAPNKNVTRAEFATLISRALKLEDGEKQPFADVKSGIWYEDTIKKAYAAGIVTGISINSFEPNKSITREEMTTMLARAKAYKAGDPSVELPTVSLSQFKDEGKISEWAKGSVGLAISSKLMKGRSVGMFEPKAKSTRAESAVVIKRLLSGL
ncbi:S-layer homology domain-containing protein [Paenibacillus sp. CMAA1364]